MVYLDEFRINPTCSVSELMERVRKDFNIKVSPSQLYRARRKALTKLRGSVTEQFAKWWDYCKGR
ncbi:hypothetical protein HYC85_013939 [Camellia sinensis]|uniref:Uncharacterized protein n=1 Tax=Camellia sinensis TaxID=4442 RepID=A0A7J7H4T4_CAMSI|nr:hypothetical protein HYC85_013939 [Camellia sinensis]